VGVLSVRVAEGVLHFAPGERSHECAMAGAEADLLAVALEGLRLDSILNVLELRSHLGEKVIHGLVETQ